MLTKKASLNQCVKYINGSLLAMKLVNIGCGTSYHQSWFNFDINPAASDVAFIDLRKGIPLSDSSVDVCYASHVLEHLTPTEGSRLVSEMKRILKPGGIVRVVVPDLEQIVKAYLLSLTSACNGQNTLGYSYDWMILELLDQLVRTSEGGEMLPFIKSCSEEMKEVIRSRIGMEADRFWNSADIDGNWMEKLLHTGPARLLNRFRFFLLRFFSFCIAGKRGWEVVDEGWFRTSGEIHRWMYDRYSLKRLLVQSGFTGIAICTFDTSRIPQFSAYSLDGEDGTVRKPDSLFMEAICP